MVTTRRVELPERPIELHEMPTLTGDAVGAPEVEYLPPQRPWLRYLGVGVVAGAVGLAIGIGLGPVVLTPTDTLAAYATSLRLEHLAQAPITSGWGFSTSLPGEKIAQVPTVAEVPAQVAPTDA
jgi:hypothetical protein